MAGDVVVNEQSVVVNKEVYSIKPYIYTYTYIHTRTHIYTYIHVCGWTCGCQRTDLQYKTLPGSVNIYIYIYTYIYVHIHTHIYTHIYIYVAGGVVVNKQIYKMTYRR